jgi:hypothetical protein
LQAELLVVPWFAQQLSFTFLLLIVRLVAPSNWIRVCSLLGFECGR